MALPDNIVFCQDVNLELNAFFSKNQYSKVAVLVDNNTKQHCYHLVQSVIPEHILIEIKSGEEQKNLNTCQQIWNELTINAFDRKSLFVNIGGGVIGDMGGFCAATYKRGIDFINIPTTLLAQVDASIGGKLGIDFQNFKNHIGIFQNPKSVFLDAVFFNTLHPLELRSGYAEIIKHCLIADGKKFNEIVTVSYEDLDWFELTRHSVAIKNKVVREDPTEKGLRKILNFGHTIGHAIESFYLDNSNKKLLHGEAIAIGMICESYLSNKKRTLSINELDRIVDYLLKIYNSKPINAEDIEGIIKLTRQDKKNEGDKIKCSLLNRIGDCAYNIEIDHQDIKASIEYFNNLLSI
ncbi:MAG: 3-dehydroquinate synthase [Cyclobacteriaceae bacterium]|nr:3-dehydroquinate synthase [Cyclobacteriaceae bacterium]